MKFSTSDKTGKSIWTIEKGGLRNLWPKNADADTLYPSDIAVLLVMPVKLASESARENRNENATVKIQNCDGTKNLIS